MKAAMTQTTPQEQFWKKQIGNVKLDLSVATYTKVPITWNEDNYVPEFNKLYFVMEGEGYVKVGDRTYYPKPGQLCLLPAKALQSYGTIGGDTFGKYWCHFTADIGEYPLFRIVETQTVVDIDDPEHMKRLFERLIRCAQDSGVTANIRVHSVLLEIIALFIESGESVKLNTQAANSMGKMNLVLQYIDEHLAESLSVEQLAQLAHFHPNYFIKIFKETTGYSPIQYLNRQRIEKAKRLLTFTNATISAVADAVGMEVSYFSRTFKEHTGFAPSEYRVMLP